MGLSFLICETEVLNPQVTGLLGGFRDALGMRVLA